MEKKLTVKIPPRKDAPSPGISPRTPETNSHAWLMPDSQFLTTETDDIHNHYILGKELGRGHFGVVQQCADLENLHFYACKSISKKNLKRKEEIKELEAEIGIMKQLQGQENIVELKEVFEDKECIHMVMELCKEGDLFDYIARKKRLSEPEAARILRQIVRAVDFCHNNGVIHRDLKPENILFASRPHNGKGNLLMKLTDFGLAARFTPGETVTGLAGSPFYMAPELIRKKPYGPEIDVWSLGVILFTALSGFLPFWGKNHEQTFAAVCKADPDYSKKQWQVISPEAKSLVKKMLTLDPTRRATLNDILYHPWMLTHCPDIRSSNKVRPFPLQPPPGFFAYEPISFLPEYDGDEEHSHNAPTYALSAPKGQFSPPKTPSPLSSPRPRQYPKFSLSQLLPTPPHTPKLAGEQNHVTPFAAALKKPLKRNGSCTESVEDEGNKFHSNQTTPRPSFFRIRKKVSTREPTSKEETYNEENKEDNVEKITSEASSDELSTMSSIVSAERAENSSKEEGLTPKRSIMGNLARRVKNIGM